MPGPPQHAGSRTLYASGLAIRSEVLDRLGVPHGFSTRSGGVSTGIFHTLNFGNPGDLPPEERDSRANIAENLRRVSAAIGAEDRRIMQVHQMHGTDVAVADPDAIWADALRADGIVTDDPRALTGVRVADCVPLLLSTLDGRVVAAVHAGWRGVIGGIASKAVLAARELAARHGFSTDLAAAIGPRIGVGAFEVGEEVAGPFESAFGPATSGPTSVVRRDMGLRPHIDLGAAVARQLAAAGLPADRIDVLPQCTASEPELFFSHRRDKARSGRMIALIGPRAMTDQG